MLLDLVGENPKNVAHSVHMFANRTAMLRDCGFRHIGAMLVRLLSQGRSEHGEHDDAAISALRNDGPSSVTDKQAAAIGSVIASSVQRSHVPATALHKVVKSNAVLRAMKSGFVWFVPMLEILTAHMAERRRSTLMRRLTSIVTVEVPSVARNETSNAHGLDDERDFTFVVRFRHLFQFRW
jgi:hypothetical protein